MQALTIKLDAEFAQALVQASERAHLSKSEPMHRALAGYLFQRDAETDTPSALEKAGDPGRLLCRQPGGSLIEPAPPGRLRPCMSQLILNTGPWVALLCRSDKYHEWAGQ